jgi:uncharacterized protein YjiS (DUF1127 family)
MVYMTINVGMGRKCCIAQYRMYLMILSNFVRLLRIWRRYDASLRELDRLGDRELADIGVSRSDIRRLAWETARQ